MSVARKPKFFEVQHPISGVISRSVTDYYK